MDASNAPLMRLIHGVIELCERTCDLAVSESRGPFALEPLREAIDGLLGAIDEFERTSPPAPGLPLHVEDELDGAVENGDDGWLLDLFGKD